MPVDGMAGAVLGTVLLALMFLAVAFWNGFPVIFYDTGARSTRKTWPSPSST